MRERLSAYLADTFNSVGQFRLDEQKKHIEFGFACETFWPKIKLDLSLDDWTFASKIAAKVIKPGLKRHANIKNVVAVCSGKGGVGKSTTARNLAYALKANGARVGLLDADIYGPSQPLMLGLQDHHPAQAEHLEDNKIPPMICDGIQSMSIGYLLSDRDAPMIWRGPMATRALSQLFFDTDWHEMDYLLIDMPPGTGDIPLTLVQKIPLTGAVVITTPQDIALLDVGKAVKMLEKVAIPVFGVVENMAMHTCSSCGHQEAIFGSGGGAKMAKQYHVPLLGQLPLDFSIRENADGGQASKLAKDSPEAFNAYQRIAVKMASELSRLKKDYSQTFNNIVLE